jgi:hypothetical protein
VLIVVTQASVGKNRATRLCFGFGSDSATGFASFQASSTDASTSLEEIGIIEIESC